MDIKIHKLEPEVSQRLEDAYGNEVFRKNCRYLGPKKYLLFGERELFDNIKDFEVRQEDVWIGGFCRSGTHWLGEQIWLLCNNLDYEKALSVPQEERVLYYDFSRRLFENAAIIGEIKYKGHKEVFGGLPSPRFFKTHLPLSLLPSNLLNKSKMVYVVRDPRDVIVSYYHFHKNHRMTQFRKDLKEYWNLFRKGQCMYCPYFENVMEYWAERNHPNLLFLSYEEMYTDLHGTIRKVTKFFGKTYTEDELRRLHKHLQFRNMKKNKAVNFYDMLGDQAQEMVRKGVAGGWREEFDEQMTKEAQEWMKENLKDVDLKFW